jgi:hypothetical protein
VRTRGLGLLLAVMVLGPLACAGVTLSSKRAMTVYERPTVRQSCLSDNECSGGAKCVKDSVQLRGICARAWSGLGAPEYLSHDPTSSAVGTGGCSRDGDCPARASCEKSARALRGNCFR